MQKVQYFCDVCGKEFDRSYYLPWEPEYCPEHIKKYRENQTSFYSSADFTEGIKKDVENI